MMRLDHDLFIDLPHIERAANMLAPLVDDDEPFWYCVLFSEYIPSRSEAVFHLARKFGVILTPDLIDGIISEALRHDSGISPDLLRSYAA